MLKLYNTLSRKKEVFLPRSISKRLLRGGPRKDKKVNRVNIFVCGITPYDFAHLGHARTYVTFDMVVRRLKEKGYDIFYLQNITDIDDKIIKKAKEKKISAKKLARIFEKEYLKDIKLLRVKTVTKYARATDYIKEIIDQIKRLTKKGFAYQIDDGIYYDISKFKDYGKLSRRTVVQAEDGVSRIDISEKKKNKGDFCLWKFWSKKEWEPKWNSPFGLGRPGWHIEDTAITEKFFGSQYDIHCGGQDLIFPHHEAEIAQMEAISGRKPFVKYWLHSGFLTINRQKMSKSLGNFITIKDFYKKYSPCHGGTKLVSFEAARILRFLILKNLYRSPFDYNEKLVSQTKKELEKIDEFVRKLVEVRLQQSKLVEVRLQQSKLVEVRLQQSLLKSDFNSFFNSLQKDFEEAMDDDFNTPKAIALIFKLINKGNSLINQNLLNKVDTKDILDFLKKIDKIFDFIFWKKTKEKIPKQVLELVKKREKSRKKGDWRKADETRTKIKKMGYSIEDTEKGAKIKRLNVQCGTLNKRS